MTSFTGKLCAAALALCQPAAVIAQADEFDPRLQPVVQQLLQEGNRNFVLNHLRLGVQAMEIGQPEVAARSFDEALGIITSIYAGSESAATAISLKFMTWLRYWTTSLDAFWIAGMYAVCSSG